MEIIHAYSDARLYYSLPVAKALAMAMAMALSALVLGIVLSVLEQYSVWNSHTRNRSCSGHLITRPSHP